MKAAKLDRKAMQTTQEPEGNSEMCIMEVLWIPWAPWGGGQGSQTPPGFPETPQGSPTMESQVPWIPGVSWAPP